MKLSKILKITMVVWILLFILFVSYKYSNPPIFCWDGQAINETTGESYMIGSCSQQYDLVFMQMLLPFIIWIVVLAIIVVSYLISIKSKH
jgi:hypothetical protein